MVREVAAGQTEPARAGGVTMGCSRPFYANCPKEGNSAPQMGCFGCIYHTSDDFPAYTTSVAKHIHEFTTDELLAEIRRRLGT